MLDDEGDLAFERDDFVLVSGPAEVRQRLEIRLRAQVGEWLLDQGWGVRWREIIVGQKSPDLPQIEAEFKDVILTTEGVLSLESFELALNTSRQLTVSFVALVADESADEAGGTTSTTGTATLSGTLSIDPDGSFGALVLTTLM